jgi:hypothetical protein
MLNIFISHAPADEAHLQHLLEWLQPMQEKYHFRVWYNHRERSPVVPFPWNLLFFWYAPPRSSRPYHSDLMQEVESAHIYLFLTSQKSINTGWIEQDVVPRAVERYQRLGNRYVRVYPVLVSASQWKNTSRLAAFASLGPRGRAINQVQPTDDAWLAVTEELRPVIEELRRNLMEENKRLGLPIDTFNKPAPAWNEPVHEVIPFPNWLGYLVIALLMWALANWYTTSCKPKYDPYWPKKEGQEAEYPRTPYQAPPPVQEVVPRDSAIRVIEER